MAKVKYGDDDVNVEVDATTQEMGEVAGALGISIQSPPPPTEEDRTIAEKMVEADISGDVGMIGEPGERTASLASSLVRKFFKQVGRHSVEPVEGGVTDLSKKLQYDPKLQPSKAPASDQLLQPDVEIPGHYTWTIEETVDRVNKAELSDFDTLDSHQLNFKTLSDEDVATTMALFAEKNAKAVDSQRRGVMADEALYEMAETLRADPAFLEKVLKIDPGTALTAEETMAAKQMLTLLTQDINTMAKNFDNLDDAGRAEFIKRRAIFESLYGNFMGARAESGRSLRVHGLETNVGEENIDQMSALLQQRDHGLNEAQIARMLEMSQTPSEVSSTLAATRPTLWAKSFDTAYEVFINGILSGVKTHIVNFTGSAIRTGVNVIDTAVAGLFGRGAATHAEAIQRGEWKAQLFGLTTGWNEALSISAKVMKTTKKYGDVDKLDTQMMDGFIRPDSYGLDPSGVAGKSVDWIGQIVRAPTERLMGGTDAFNKYMAERMSLSGQAYSKAVGMQKELNLDEATTLQLLQDLIETPTEEMKIIAKQDGKMMTFQEDLGVSGKELQKAIQGNRFSKTIIPFFKTPMNLLKQGYLERTPLGMLTQEYRDNIAAGGRRSQLARSKMTTGTMLTMSLGMLAMNGNINGHYSKDKDIRRAQMNAGWEPMSFVIKADDGTTTYVPFDRVEPFSYLFGMVADLSNIQKEMELRDTTESEDDMFQMMVSSVILAVGENTLNKSFMTGIRSAMEAMTEGGYKAEMWAKNQMNAFTPYSGARRNLASVVDSTARRPDGLIDYWQEQVTFWGQNAAPIIDVQGREIKRKHLYIPWDFTELSKNKIDLEVLRIAEETGVSPIPATRRKMDGVKLTPTQQAKWGKLARSELILDGRTFSETINDMITTKNYKALHVDTQIDMLREWTKLYDNAAKERIKTDDDSLMNKILRHKFAPQAKLIANEEGGDPSDVLTDIVNKLNY